ncbi:MAG: hypothetical protein AB7H90_01550 [Alphaproteobacteria bacterium]
MTRLPLAVAALLLLAGCSLSTVDVSRSVLSSDQMARIERLCRSAAPGLVAAASDHMPASVREIAAYPVAYCDELLNGRVPATTDANTAAWLDRALRLLRIAATAARIALPGL